MKYPRKYNYFHRCRCVDMFFRNLGKQQINDKTLRWWACSACVHRFDSHTMNCLECCPGQRVIEYFEEGGPE